MDNRTEVRDFLNACRARITPEHVGVLSRGARRVPGLRRSEVAQLAGVSLEYYVRMERGNLAGVSDGVLDAVADALRLDDAERAHLFDLARAAAGTRPSRQPRSVQPEVRSSVRQILAGMSGLPAFVRNAQLDVLAINPLGEALYTQAFADPRRPVNLARFVFLDPRAHLLHPDWNDSATTTVALLRTEAGRNPFNQGLTDLVGELSTRSDEFRVRWAAHTVRLHYAGAKHFHHPAVGDLHLSYDALELPAAHGLTLTVYSAEAGSASADGLKLLAAWAVDQQPREGGERWSTRASERPV